jgi:chromosome condensin MukBEF ATPase and DNA-binding subunit MukB
MRWRCKAALHQACSNKSITGEHLEARALAGLRSRLLTPEIINRFAQHLQAELQNQQRSAHKRRDDLEAALVEARSRAAKVLKRIEEDDDAPRSLSARLKELEAEEDRLNEELASSPDRVVVRLPANYEAVFRSAVAGLEQHLLTKDAAPSRNAIRALIEKSWCMPAIAGAARCGGWNCTATCSICRSGRWSWAPERQTAPRLWP